MLIAPFVTGLDTDSEAWISPPDSFTELDNCHIHHGYIEKRQGYRVFGQLQGMATALVITGITQASPGVVTVASTASLTNGQLVYISGVVGMTEVNDNIYTVANKTLTTFELSGVDTTGFTAYTSDGTAQPIIDSTDRVMGIYRYIMSDGSQSVLAFNTTRANLYDGLTKTFLPLDASPVMNGSATDYIWATQWQSTEIPNRLYFTNGKGYNGTTDGIRYFDGSGTGNVTVAFRPSLGGGRNLYGGKLLFVLKQRLVVLGVYEYDGATLTYNPQRARWCQAQGPSNWDDLVPGGGGFVDAPTGDRILSARALQDQIIVNFTNSIWTLRPVADPALPYRWDKLNDFRACDGKMATQGFDTQVAALGVRGITATDGLKSPRIDDRIQDFTTDQINNDQFDKVFCLRSYADERWWTLYADLTNTENNKALIFDEMSKGFSTYTINMNCMGYGNLVEDYGLDDFIAENDLDVTIEEVGEDTLQDYFWQDNQETTLGGNITGTVFLLETGGDDNGAEISASLVSAQWNPFNKEGKEALLTHVDFYVDTQQNTTMLVEFFKDNAFSPYASQVIDFLPNLNYICDIQSISKASPCLVNAAQHGLTTGAQIYIYTVKGMLEINDQLFTITVIDKDSFTLNGINSSGYGTYTGDGQVVLRKFYTEKIWKSAYAGGIGFGHTIRLTSSGINTSFRISAIKPYFKPRGKRTVN